MPLFPVPTYTSWQLACIAAINPAQPPAPENAATAMEIREELRLRQISAAEIEQMIALAGEIQAEIVPMVCMDFDDLHFGILSRFEDGLIDAIERDRLFFFVDTHVDAPRMARSKRPAERKSYLGDTLLALYGLVGFGFVFASGSGYAFIIWLLGIFVVVWLLQSLPVLRSRLRRFRAD